MGRRESGVSLMELLITIMVVGILAGIAYPSYRAQMQRGNRSEAKIGLEQAAGSLEKCFTRYMTYADIANCPMANQLQGGGFLTPKGTYRIRSQALAANAFTIQAVPQAAQTGDLQCATFTLDERGARGVTGTSSARPGDCWNF